VAWRGVAYLCALWLLVITVVVTGASDGIGREFAIQLARAGFNVLLAARNQAKLDTVVDDIGASGLGCFFFASLSHHQNCCACIKSQCMWQ
jgi:NAD(P)-dependent dehydrogenase (short-subunit alcohol dehydrogenase family)